MVTSLGVIMYSQCVFSVVSHGFGSAVGRLLAYQNFWLVGRRVASGQWVGSWGLLARLGSGLDWCGEGRVVLWRAMHGQPVVGFEFTLLRGFGRFGLFGTRPRKSVRHRLRKSPVVNSSRRASFTL